MLRKLIKHTEHLEAFDHVSEPVAGRAQRATRQDAVENALSGTWLGHKLHPVFTAFAAHLGGHLTLVRGVGVNHTAFEPEVTGWTDVASLSELTEGKPARVTPGGVPVVLVRRNGSVHGLSAGCAHAGGPLDEGAVSADGRTRCPWHGSVFQLADGRVTRGPASVDQPSRQFKVDGGRVLMRSTAAPADG